MGPRLKLPKYVHGFLDRHGVPRFYYRRPGFAAVKLPGLPYSPEFTASYMSAIGGQSLPVGAAKVMPGTMRAVALSYFAAPAFRGLRPSTQREYRAVIERFCKDHGEKRAALLQREHIVRMMAARAEKPGAANKLRKALRALMGHSIDIGLRADDPTRDVKAIRTRSGGYHSWTDEEIARFEDRHPVGTRARLALALLLYTGYGPAPGRCHPHGCAAYPRRGNSPDAGEDRRRARHSAAPGTGRHHRLQLARSSDVLVTRFGAPFGASAFSHWFRDRCAMRRASRTAQRTGCAKPPRASWPKPAVQRTRLGPSLAIVA
jgi:hypothetical protein